MSRPEESESPLTLEEACSHPLFLRKGGNPVPLQTLRRWMYVGLRGFILESRMRSGYRRVIFPSAIERFDARINGAAAAPSEIESSERRATDRHERVKRSLARKTPRRNGRN
jgi:hypothetical protein